MLDYNKLQAFVENAIDDRAYKTWEEEMMAIDEATYYGKNKQLLEVERILDEMIEIGKRQGGVTSQKFTDKMYDVAERLGNIFGFYSFQINNSTMMLIPPVLLAATTTTGCTLCHSVIYKYTKLVVDGKPTYVIDLDKHHQGVRFKPGSRYSLRMFLSVNLFKPSNEYSFTGGQILAIMLHEIGHNFYVGPVNEIGEEFIYMLTCPDLVHIVRDLLLTVLFADVSAHIDSLFSPNVRKTIMRNVGWLSDLLEFPVSIMNTVFTTMGIIFNLVDIAGLIAGKLVLVPTTVITSFLGYDSEKYSDAFATSYGYGVELSQALDNMDHRSLYRAQTYIGQDIQDIIYALYTIPFEIIMCLTDVHPNTQGRLMNDIKYLEACGKDIKDPKLRKEYEQNVKEMYELRESIKNYNGGNPIKVSNKFRAAIQDAINLSDIKDLTSALKPKYTKYTNLDM